MPGIYGIVFVPVFLPFHFYYYFSFFVVKNAENFTMNTIYATICTFIEFSLCFSAWVNKIITVFLAAWSGCILVYEVFLNYNNLIFPQRFTLVAQALHRMDAGLDMFKDVYVQLIFIVLFCKLYKHFYLIESKSGLST